MRPVTELVSDALARLLRDQPLTDAKVRFAWRMAAGAAIARATSVTLDGRGTLHVSVSSQHWRAELERAAPNLRARLARLLGTEAPKWIVVGEARPAPSAAPGATEAASGHEPVQPRASSAGPAGRPATAHRRRGEGPTGRGRT
jgi:hypothetical protein